MPERRRIRGLIRSATIAVVLIGAAAALFRGGASILPTPHAMAQSDLGGAVVDTVSEPDLAGLLNATGAIRMAEALPGLEIGVAEYPPFGIRLHVFDFMQSHYTLRAVEQRSTTGSHAQDFFGSGDDVFAINGGFFERARNGALSPSGLLIVDGVVVSREHRRAGSGVIYTDGTSVAIAYRKNVRNHSAIEDAVQVGPILVDPGGEKGIYKNSFDRYNRSAICLRDSSFTAFVVEGGISLFQFADLLSLPVAEGGFGCDIAINLDGGPSTQAVLRAGKMSRAIPGGTTVQNGLVVSKRPGR